ncbi:hypothetical protein SAMN04487957_101405 [Halomonas shengliensis]|uniref:DUF945 domain-containing protein n=1 Tax=Halomonas shengliensis TaxID=419597 RepID=A0A1H0DGY8_9GAMM|nr:hypothetical protein [Halomonas shengliensis]SDN69271.1 hypothetical protein SAMN04487957_101405 [Halomonas shengliensis]
MGKLFGLIVIGGLAYGGLYFYYGVSVKQAIEQQLDARGFDAIQVERVDFPVTAPLSQDTRLAATLDYRGAEATLDIRVIGHPVFSDEITLELDGLQSLSLTLGTPN